MRRTALAGLVFLSIAAPSPSFAAPVSDLPLPAAADPLGPAPTRWAADPGGVGLGDLAPDAPNGGGQAVFGESSAVTSVSRVYDPSETYRLFEQVGFLWTQSLGVVFLGTWNPYGISRDGSTIVGVDCRHVAFDGLDESPGAPRAGAYVLSSDGATVLGYAASERGIEAMRWTAAAGRVADDLPRGGTEHRASSARPGREIVGPSDPRDAGAVWLAMIPEPAVGWLVALGLAGLASRRRSA